MRWVEHPRRMSDVVLEEGISDVERRDGKPTSSSQTLGLSQTRSWMHEIVWNLAWPWSAREAYHRTVGGLGVKPAQDREVSLG